MFRRRALPALCSFAVLLAPLCSPAQSFTAATPAPQLSAAAMQKLHALEALNTLPAQAWHFHAGDLPHGESAPDASWPTLAPNSDAGLDAAWFRATVEVPKLLNGYDITGSRITFQLRADANGPLPEIVYFNGRRVALGDDLEPITLFDPAHPGDRIEVAVKLLRTVDAKRFRGAEFRIEPQATATESRSPHIQPDDLRVECLTAASILPALATPRKDLLPQVEAAVAAIDTDALEHGEQRTFQASLQRAQALLDPLRPTLGQAHVLLAGNSHIDAAWLWPESETIDVVHRTFTTALQLMNEYPHYTFTQSAAQYTDWMADKYPKLNDQIRERVKEGRWEIVGGMWVEPDLNLPDGESLVRQLLVGQQTFEKQYGVRARIGWNPDSFGYNWQLPQIYKRSGLDYFVTQKMHWNDTNQLPFRLFWWQSPDGSKVLTYFPTDYVHDNVSPDRIARDFAQSADRNPGTTSMLDLYGIGDHGGGPTRVMLDQAEHNISATQAATQPAAGQAAAEVLPTMRYGTAQAYFNEVQSKLNPDSPTLNYRAIADGLKLPAPPAGLITVPTWKDELYFEYHRGIFTSQAKHKENMRRSEVATLDAEKLAAMAWLNGLTYPADALRESWKKITFNQFHDLAAGSGIGVIYRDAQKEYTEVFHSDRAITEDSLETLAAKVNTSTSAGTPVLLFNSLAWPRREVVELNVQLDRPAHAVRLLDAANHELATQLLGRDEATHRFKLLAPVEVPAMGYTVLHAEPLVASRAASAIKNGVQLNESPEGFTLENARLRLVIRRADGCITSILHKGKGTESLAPGACGNELQTFKDTPKNYDAWNIDPGTLDQNTPIHALDSISASLRGPVRSTVRIERTWGKSHFVQEISLGLDSDAATIDNTVDWHETHVLLKAAFPLAVTADHATYEIPYGSIARTTTRANSWEKAQFEVPAMRWADLGDGAHGFSLVNDSKYGYDALGNVLRLSLLRSPTWPDAEADRGMQRFRYAIYPHQGDWKQSETVRRGWEFNYPLHATQVAPHQGTWPAEQSWASVENRNVVLTAIKQSEQADGLTLRMYEWAGEAGQVKLHVPAGASSASLTNLMEKAEGAPLAVESNSVSLPIHPYEIVTVKVTYPGAKAAVPALERAAN